MVTVILASAGLTDLQSQRDTSDILTSSFYVLEFQFLNCSWTLIAYFKLLDIRVCRYVMVHYLVITQVALDSLTSSHPVSYLRSIHGIRDR